MTPHNKITYKAISMFKYKAISLNRHKTLFYGRYFTEYHVREICLHIFVSRKNPVWNWSSKFVSSQIPAKGKKELGLVIIWPKVEQYL